MYYYYICIITYMYYCLETLRSRKSLKTKMLANMSKMKMSKSKKSKSLESTVHTTTAPNDLFINEEEDHLYVVVCEANLKRKISRR